MKGRIWLPPHFARWLEDEEWRNPAQHHQKLRLQDFSGKLIAGVGAGGADRKHSTLIANPRLSTSDLRPHETTEAALSRETLRISVH